MKPPKPNKRVAVAKTISVWFRPMIRPGTSPEDWRVLKLSGNKTGYVEAKALR